jgi:hypothetical protein
MKIAGRIKFKYQQRRRIVAGIGDRKVPGGTEWIQLRRQLARYAESPEFCEYERSDRHELYFDRLLVTLPELLALSAEVQLE